MEETDGASTRIQKGSGSVARSTLLTRMSVGTRIEVGDRKRTRKKRMVLMFIIL